jgi:hypothetical protein
MTRYLRPLTPPLCAGITLAIIGLWFGQAYAQNSATRKLIYYGWGSPDSQYVRDHWPQMEEMPFDGVGIKVAVDRQAWQQGKKGTDNQLGWQVMGQKGFQIDGFRAAIADLKAARWKTLTDNFLPVALSPRYAARLNWFDDRRWHIVLHNFGILAQIAADGGLKGLILDPEHYGFSLFHYADQRQQVDQPFEEYVKVVRQRGREVMTAIAAHLPHAVCFSLYGYTLPLDNLKRSKSLQEAAYGLLPAFYDGLLEAMPAAAVLIDGYEHAFAFKRRNQFLNGYRSIHREAVKLSAVPERYRERVRAGFGLWLDHKEQPDYFTSEEWRQAVRAALEVSDGYVWVYSHGPRFFPLAGVETSYIQAMADARYGVRR